MRDQADDLTEWEAATNTPGQFTVKYLEDFLLQHPVIKDGPRYGRWKDKTSAEAVAEIRKARAKGETLRSIADRYGCRKRESRALREAIGEVASGSRLQQRTELHTTRGRRANEFYDKKLGRRRPSVETRQRADRVPFESARRFHPGKTRMQSN